MCVLCYISSFAPAGPVPASFSLRLFVVVIVLGSVVLGFWSSSSLSILSFLIPWLDFEKLLLARCIVLLSWF